MKVLGTGAVVAGLLLGGSALAQTAIHPVELERLHANPGAESSLINATGELLQAGTLRLGAFGQYERGMALLHEGNGGVDLPVNNRATGSLSLAYAANDWLQLNAELPVVGYQRSNNIGPAGYQPLAKSGVAMPRVSARFGVVQQKNGAPLNFALQMGFGVPLADTGVLGKDDALSIDPALSLGYRAERFAIGGEVEGHIRPRRDLIAPALSPDDQAESELRGGVSASYFVTPRVRLELDTRAGLGFSTSNLSGEVLGGARVQVNPGLEVFAVAGPGFGSLTGTPLFRGLIGAALNFDTAGGSHGTAAPVAAGPVCVEGQPHRAADCPDLDDDGDKIANAVDSCPTLAEDPDGYADQDGCPDPDNDGDGVADASDQCPTEVGPSTNHGCQVKDADLDGIADASDKCPTVKGDVAHEGCAPPADADQDGVADAVDNCVTVAGSKTNHGCPDKQKQLVVIQKDNLQILDKVYFSSGGSRIKARSHRLLNQIADIVKSHPDMPKLEIEGHTDNRGSPARNLVLSQKRAQAVRHYLERRGVPASRLEAKGYGPSRPIETNMTAAGREANRRVEFRFATPTPAAPATGGNTATVPTHR